MNEVTKCCNHPALYYIFTNKDGEHVYEPWDFCPKCLECCSLYNPKSQNKLNKVLEGANDGTIKRALKRLSEECNFGRRDDVVNSKTDSVHNSGIEEYQYCSP
tara:strand:- start:871 stop:1179 length:309 start_codon:yes stop_codon:yes gene_type:complete